MPTRRVLVDIYSWTEATGIPTMPFTSRTAVKGAEVDLSNAHPSEAVEIARGEALGALGSDADAAAALQAEGEPGSVTADQIRSMTADDLVAYLGAHPSEAERIRDLENGRPRGGRKTVLDGVERVIDARDADAAERAEQDALARAAAGGAPRL